MKLYLLAALLLTITLLMNSCGLSNSPENTANQFMKYLEQENYEAAKRISTETTGKLVDIIQAAQSLSLGNKNQPKKKTPIFECDCEQENEKATCQCCQEEDQENCIKLDVFRVEGQWLVDMNKENVPH
ncbi:MAG: hypothetical protein AB8E82_10990 [Aureispira sp.]